MTIRQNAEVSVAVALSVVFSLFRIKLPHLLYGGSVSLQALPIFVIAFRHGWRTGMAAGGVYGVVNFILTPFYVHPLQVLLDYPMAFGAVGMAGLTARDPQAGGFAGWGGRLRMLAGLGLGTGLRFGVHFVSGVVFFSQFAPEGQPVWLYSLIYNGSYLIPEIIIYILLLQFVLRRIIIHA